MYLGEIFAVYAVIGIFLIPLYKVPSRWLVPLSIILILQMPYVIWVIAMLIDPSIGKGPFDDLIALAGKYDNTTDVFRDGSLGDVLRFNLWSGHIFKWIWIIWSSRWLQVLGLFIAGMLIGRSGIHRDGNKMV